MSGFSWSRTGFGETCCFLAGGGGDVCSETTTKIGKVSKRDVAVADESENLRELSAPKLEGDAKFCGGALDSGTARVQTRPPGSATAALCRNGVDG